MKKIILLGLLFLFNINQYNAQCPEDDETKVLLVGDSWAFFMGVDQTINKVFKNWGFPEYKFFTNLTLAENGAKTDDFMKPSKQGEIANQLISKPSIKFVHLSLAGNDLLGNWKSQSFTQFQTDSLMQSVEDSLYAVIDFIKGIRPDVQIIWGGYAYPNFDEVLHTFPTSAFPQPSLHPFYGQWEDMEFPSNQEINDQLNAFEDKLAADFANDPRVEFVKATGITQYTYGQIDPLGVSPFGTYAQFSVPLPEGNPAYPSPMESMRDYQLTKDCFHLSSKGFRDLFGYVTQKYYFKALMDDKYIIAQDSLKNGSVASDGSVSTDLLIGNDSGIDHQTILTFNTLNNLDSVAEKASIFLHRIEQTGGNPIDEQLTIEINEGAFGASAAIEPSDFNEIGDENGTPCIHGSNSDGNWVRIDLPQELLEYITVNSITQFKISAPNSVDALVKFSGTDDLDFAPVLNITYGNQSTVSVPQDEISQEVMVYPNPSSDIVNIRVDHAQIKQIKMLSVEGREVVQTTSTKVDVSHFPSGTYFIKVITNKGVSTQKFIKR